MSADGKNILETCVTENKIFFTLSLIHLSGRNWNRFDDVMQAPAFVFKELLLYLDEFKKVISFTPADDKDSMPKIFLFFSFGILFIQDITLAIVLKEKGPFFLKKWFETILF